MATAPVKKEEIVLNIAREVALGPIIASLIECGYKATGQLPDKHDVAEKAVAYLKAAQELL